VFRFRLGITRYSLPQNAGATLRRLHLEARGGTVPITHGVADLVDAAMRSWRVGAARNAGD
jgi:hypothetical protein